MNVDYGRLDGRRTYYRLGNPSGEPVVVLPGLSDAFGRGEPDRLTAELLGRRYAAGLTGRYDVWVISRPRHVAAGTTTRDMASGYAAVIDEQDLWPATVVGVSMGGFVAQHLAADYPDYVDRLALVSSAFRLGGHGEQVLRRWRRLAGKGKWDRLVGEMVSESTTGMRRQALPPLVRALASAVSYRPAVPADVVLSCTACLDHDTEGRLDEISVPTLVAGGTADRLFPKPRFRDTKAGIADATLALFDGVGHDLLTAASDELAAVLGPFVAGRPLADS